MPGDLHNHSTCSDGSVPIHRLPLMAARVGLDTMAISDHDTLLSVNYCYEHPVQDGVRLLPATELTGYDHEHKHRVHLLCYFPDPESRELKEHCDILRQRRNECGLQSAKEIEALYPQFRTEQALEYAKDSGVLFKSGIMEALHQLGLCDAVYGKLYSYLFGWEPRGVVLHQVKYPSVQEVIATRNSPEDRAECAALCEQYGLIHTGGTDFHGANHKVPHPVGTCTTADDQVARILELAHKRRGIDV